MSDSPMHDKMLLQLIRYVAERYCVEYAINATGTGESDVDDARCSLAEARFKLQAIARLTQRRVSADDDEWSRYVGNLEATIQSQTAQIAELLERLREVVSLMDDPCPHDKATTLAAARAAINAAGEVARRDENHMSVRENDGEPICGDFKGDEDFVRVDRVAAEGSIRNLIASLEQRGAVMRGATVARIAGNLLSGVDLWHYDQSYTAMESRSKEARLIERAVQRARAIVAEVERTERVE